MEICAENLGSIRGGRVILNDISFKTASGSSLLVSGANGAGKTTLLRIITGFLKPQSGSVALKDKSPEQEELSLGQCCHYIGHQNAIKPAMSVSENLHFWGAFLGGDTTPDHIEACLSSVQLDHAVQFSAGILSAGQKKRLNLARLLIVPRPIWVLDEPSSSLDKQGNKIIASLMKEHRKKGGIIIASSHEDFGFKFDKELKLTSARARA